MHILLIEDDEILGDGLCAVLRQHGHQVTWAETAQQALACRGGGPRDFILLDLNLPDRSGFDLLAQIRSDDATVPVLVITARNQVPDRVRALDLGADDYMVKPFDMKELLARIRAIYRRSGRALFPAPDSSGLLLDGEQHRVSYQGRTVDLSLREFSLLQALLERPGRVLTRSRLEQAVYGWNRDVASNAIEVHIHHLRKKLGADRIKTVRGIGYMLNIEEK